MPLFVFLWNGGLTEVYKPRRADKSRGWGGNRGTTGNNRVTSDGMRETEEKMSPDLPCLGAVVIAIESHPKKPHMYRIALKLDLDESALEDHGGVGEDDLDSGEEPHRSMDWNDEVDALIARAQTVRSENEAFITVHEDTLVSWRLLKGRQLSAEEYETLKQDEQIEEAYRSALWMLERKSRTAAELSMALKRKGYVPEVVGACLERLQTRRMIDDTVYAKRFTEQRAVGQRKGRMLIRQELLQRGIAREDVEQAIGELDGQVEQDSALALARKRWPNIKGNDRERKQKLMAMLMRRGFPGPVVRMAVQQVATESGQQELDSEFGENDTYDSEYMED